MKAKKTSDSRVLAPRKKAVALAQTALAKKARKGAMKEKRK